ncbi:hypothetical protein DVK00_18685 [Haloarcula sp. Atlit-47R]|nr:hypothetical protein DVK00_18685 [Haloarcula sp. Atlit-47R]
MGTEIFIRERDRNLNRIGGVWFEELLDNFRVAVDIFSNWDSVRPWSPKLVFCKGHIMAVEIFLISPVDCVARQEKLTRYSVYLFIVIRWPELDGNAVPVRKHGPFEGSNDISSMLYLWDRFFVGNRCRRKELPELHCRNGFHFGWLW